MHTHTHTQEVMLRARTAASLNVVQRPVKAAAAVHVLAAVGLQGGSDRGESEKNKRVSSQNPAARQDDRAPPRSPQHRATHR